MQMKTPDKQVAFRMPLWLWEDINEAAKRSGWDFSKQARHELASIRGKAHVPYVPSPVQSDDRLPFKGPAQGAPRAKSQRRRRAA